MKVYYIAAIYAAEKYKTSYEGLNKVLQKHDPALVNENFFGLSLEKLKNPRTGDSREQHYKKVLASIKKADLIVAEVSYPSSINVGHEITLALEFEKPVLALYSEGNSPMFLEGYQSDKFILAPYSLTKISDLDRIINSSIKKLMKAIDIRFNFFVSPKISTYLDWVSKEKRIPRSVYLRKLIEEDMRKEKDYSEGN